MTGRRPVSGRFTILALMLIAVSGSAGLLTRPELEDPKAEVRLGLITTKFPGASPTEVETLVSDPVERALLEVDGIESVESSSLRGVSIVSVRLTDEASDVEASWSAVHDRLSEVVGSLPNGAGRPVLVDKRRWDSYTMVNALVDDGTTSPSTLARWAKELESRIRFVPGTRFTEIFGSPQEEVLVELPPDALAGARLTVAEVASAIARRDSDVPDASSETARHTLPVHLSGDVDELEALRRVVVRGDSSGRQLRVDDVAIVRRAEMTPASTKAVVDGRRAVVVAARMEPAGRIDDWTARQDAVLQDFESLLPGGIALKPLFSQKHYTDRRSSQLFGDLAASMLLVALATGLLMGWRAAIPVCLSMPLTLLVVFFLMIPFGVSFHQMSIAGLIIAMGILIDNAIIVVDYMERLLAAGCPATSAVATSVRHLAVPLAGANLTTILGFSPVLLIPGPTGEFLGQLAWAVVASLAASLVLSLTVIPHIALRFLGRTSNTTRRPAAPGGRVPFRWYRALLEGVVRRPRLACGLTAMVPLAGFAAAGALPEQFFPAADRDHFHFSIRMPPSASVRDTEAVARTARDIILEDPEVADCSLFIGTNAPMLHYSMLTLDESRTDFAQGVAHVRTERATAELVRRVQRALDKRLPEAQAVVTWVEQGPAVAAPIELRIYGPSLETLAELGNEARRVLSSIPGVAQSRTTLDLGGPQIAVSVRQQDAMAVGLTDREIADQLAGQLRGVVRSRLSEETEEVPVRVRVKDADRVGPQDILSLPIRGGASEGHRLVPLGAVADWTVDRQIFCIPRRNGSRCNAVYGYTAAGELPIVLEGRLRDALEETGFTLPPGYRVDFGGASRERNSAVGNLLAYTAILGVLMLAVLVVTLRSFRLAIVIGVVAILSVGMGFLSLWLFSYPMGLVAIIGLLGMAGVAVNDSIMVLCESQDAVAADRPVSEAVYGATRHVVTTLVTDVAGVLPLIWTEGDFWPPMMVALGGGVAGATLLALFFTPAAFVLIAGRTTSKARHDSSATGPPSGRGRGPVEAGNLAVAATP